MAAFDPVEPYFYRHRMKIKKATSLQTLEDRVGYKFNNPALLKQALTHASSTSKTGEHDNERLEFLGDRVLALLAADALMGAYPDADEGGLATRLNALVRRETCASIAQDIGLGPFLILADSEVRAGGREKMAILADGCEALMGALYLDGGLSAVGCFFAANWSGRIEDLTTPPQDAKTALQEWSQGQGLPAPYYRVIERQGPDHKPEFRIEVSLPDLASSVGRGASKKVAEREAALAMLVREGVWSKEHLKP